MTVTLDKGHELIGNGYLLGVGGENESEQLIINIAYDALLDKWAYIEFEQNNKKYTTDKLTVVNGQIIYTLTNSVLVQGLIDIQVVFRDANGFVWKSNKRRFAVSEEINASEELQKQHPDFISKAEQLLNDITVNSEKVDAFLSSDAEKGRVAAEEQRQANEASRVDAENARRTEFSGWANSLGNLNTYDKRLINLEEAGVGTLFNYQEDNTTAYSKTVPPKALPYARLNKVGGMTYKANNALKDTKVKSVGGYAIPEAIQALDGYGLGIDDTCYNYIDFERKVFVKKVGVIDGSQIIWSYHIDGYFQTSNIDKKNGVTNVLHGFYEIIGDKIVGTDKKIRGNANSNVVYITDTNYNETTLSAFKAQVGLIMYELAEPIETDISAYITDNYIKVDGSIVFENDSAQAVPSEITFIVKR